MNNYLSAIDQGLWLSIILVQFFACWTVLKRGFYNSWKAFSYYVGGFAEAVLLSLVVLEILVKILDPFEALPGRNIAWFCFWAVLGISIAVAISVSQPSRHDVSYNLALMIHRTIFLADAALLWAVLFQARSLGITWRSSVAEIALGFVLFLTVQAITQFLMGIYDNRLFLRIAGEVGQAAYLCSLGSWIWTMFHRDPLAAPPSAETLTQIRAFDPKT